MTLEEIKAIPDDWITVEQMADFLKCDEQALRMQAKKDRGKYRVSRPCNGRKTNKVLEACRSDTFERLKGA